MGAWGKVRSHGITHLKWRSALFQALFTLYGFNYPLTVALLQMAFIAPVCYGVARPKLEWSTARGIMPLALVNVLNVVSGLIGVGSALLMSCVPPPPSRTKAGTLGASITQEGDLSSTEQYHHAGIQGNGSRSMLDVEAGSRICLNSACGHAEQQSCRRNLHAPCQRGCWHITAGMSGFSLALHTGRAMQ